MRSGVVGSRRVLHVFGRMDRGGAELRTLDVANALDPQAFHIDYCALSGLPGELDAEIERGGSRVFHCRLEARFMVRFFMLLKREQYDVVHSHVWFVSGLILLLAWLSGVSTRIAHFRTTGEQTGVGAARACRDRILRQLIDLCATDILAVSQGAMDACWLRYRAADERCQVVYNGVDERKFRSSMDKYAIRELIGLSTKGTLCIHVGRFDGPKNHSRLVRIFREVLIQDSSANLLLVGGGQSSTRDEVYRLVTELGLASSVHFTGVRDDVHVLLQAADVMIFPSLWEGLPGSVIEACAAGLPVIASDLPGVREIASRVPGVSIMSLDEMDVVWAASALAAIGDHISYRDDDAFRQSVFTVRASADTLAAIWSGGVDASVDSAGEFRSEA